MKFILFFILISDMLYFNLSFGQSMSSGSFPKPSIIYGMKFFESSNLKQLNSLEKKIEFGNPIQLVGFEYSGSSDTLSGFFSDGQISFCQILPQKINISDSLLGNITGNNFSIGLGRDIFRKAKKFDLIITGGFNMGRMRLYGSEVLKQKNFYFSPKISIQPMVKVGKLALSIRGDYEYDVTSPTWRKTLFQKGQLLSLKELRQSGLSTFLCLGFTN